MVTMVAGELRTDAGIKPDTVLPTSAREDTSPSASSLRWQHYEPVLSDLQNFQAKNHITNRPLLPMFAVKTEQSWSSEAKPLPDPLRLEKVDLKTFIENKIIGLFK